MPPRAADPSKLGVGSRGGAAARLPAAARADRGDETGRRQPRGRVALGPHQRRRPAARAQPFRARRGRRQPVAVAPHRVHGAGHTARQLAQVFIRRNAAAADAFLREVGEALLELNHGLQRMDDRRLPNELRRKFAMMVRKTGGSAIASAATALAMVPTNPSRGAVPLAMAHVVFKSGDAVHKISVTETYGAVEMVDLMHYAFSYVIALSTALAQGAERADTAAGGGGAGGGGDDQQEGRGGGAGIVGSMSGTLLAKVLALPPGGELRLEL